MPDGCMCVCVCVCHVCRQYTLLWCLGIGDKPRVMRILDSTSRGQRHDTAVSDGQWSCPRGRLNTRFHDHIVARLAITRRDASRETHSANARERERERQNRTCEWSSIWYAYDRLVTGLSRPYRLGRSASVPKKAPCIIRRRCKDWASPWIKRLGFTAVAVPRFLSADYRISRDLFYQRSATEDKVLDYRHIFVSEKRSDIYSKGMYDLIVWKCELVPTSINFQALSSRLYSGSINVTSFK